MASIPYFSVAASKLNACSCIYLPTASVNSAPSNPGTEISYPELSALFVTLPLISISCIPIFSKNLPFFSNTRSLAKNLCCGPKLLSKLRLNKFSVAPAAKIFESASISSSGIRKSPTSAAPCKIASLVVRSGAFKKSFSKSAVTLNCFAIASACLFVIVPCLAYSCSIAPTKASRGVTFPRLNK